MTTKSNVEQHKKAIESSSLPLTLRDAMAFCRGIKVPYLWVDSLCILQGRDGDWVQESAQMRHIYENSCVTIAVHGPESCKLGFLGKQEYGRDTWQRSFHTNWQGSGSLGKMHVRMGSTWSQPKTSLEQRGWTLQESILPTRILHFTSNEMVWECNNRNICECGHAMITEPTRQFLKSIGKEHPYQPNYPEYDLFCHGWMRIIEEYSNRKLTVETDKLVAISGLAQMMSESMTPRYRLLEGIQRRAWQLWQKGTLRPKATYLSGVWREGLPRQLLWCIEYPTQVDNSFQHTRPLEYRAPSWSWASIDGPVCYDDMAKSSTMAEKSHIIISNYHCSPVLPSNPMGLITGGYLVVTGPLAPVQLITVESEKQNHS
jgi:hypothetical protein